MLLEHVDFWIWANIQLDKDSGNLSLLKYAKVLTREMSTKKIKSKKAASQATPQCTRCRKGSHTGGEQFAKYCAGMCVCVCVCVCVCNHLINIVIRT